MNGSAGYSGTPLWKKLGLAEGMSACILNAPFDYVTALAPLPCMPRWQLSPDASTGFVHLFVVEAAVLAAQLVTLRQQLSPEAMLWVSWPKKASRQTTDISEDRIRELALPLGWVDVKVCAVDATWSGLKLVVRKALR